MGLELSPLPGDQEASGEDHQTPEVVLVQCANLADQVAIEGHLVYDCTQDDPAGSRSPQAEETPGSNVTAPVPAGIRRASTRVQPNGGFIRPVCASHRSMRLGSCSGRRSATTSSRARYRIPMVAVGGCWQPNFAQDRMPKA